MIAFLLRLLRLGRHHDIQEDIKRFDDQRDASLERARQTRAGGIEAAFLPPLPHKENGVAH